ncbi:MAG: hypothetical protein GQ553_03720 [Nitrosomonadaceae bacterium]|nr:hypothetical protein [Nitrosomonadaceae bacterium]
MNEYETIRKMMDEDHKDLPADYKMTERYKIEVTRETKEVFEVHADDIAHAHQLMQRQLDLLDYDLICKVFKRLKWSTAKYCITGMEFPTPTQRTR